MPSFTLGSDMIDPKHKSQYRSNRTAGNKDAPFLFARASSSLVLVFPFFNRTWFSLSKVLGGSNGQTCYIVLWVILMKLTFALNTCKQKSGKADEVPGTVGIFQ